MRVPPGDDKHPASPHETDGEFSPENPHSPDPASLTYEPYFGLREKAFSLSPNPRFFFKDAPRAAAFDSLVAAIRRREGIIALTGEVGTGKTTLCRAVLEGLDRKTFAAYVPDPILTREDLLKTLLVDFGVVSVEEIRAGRLRGTTRTELSYPLYEFLTSLQPLRAFAVVIIDEAQHLPPALLEEIRILADMERREKLLQFLLVGQPELQAALAAPEMRQLTQRLTVRVELDPFGRGDIDSYVSHRLAVAGNGGVTFDHNALSLAYAGSGGIPRVINLLCDRALAHAASMGASSVGGEHIAAAARDLRIPLEGPSADLNVGARTASAVGATRGIASAPLPGRPSRAEPQRRQGLPSTYQMRHDAHYVDELESRARTSTRERVTADTHQPAADMFGDDIKDRRPVRMVSIGVAVIALSFGLWTYRATAPRQPPPAQPNAAAPQGPDSGISLSGLLPADPAVSSATPAARGVQFAIQMATFRGRERSRESVEQLEASGYRAFQTEMSLPSGERAFAVLLGPYLDRAAAEQDYERARQIRGYAPGRIVEMPSAGP